MTIAHARSIPIQGCATPLRPRYTCAQREQSGAPQLSEDIAVESMMD
ncbi:hypothetical protein AG1IA_04877 [Rhizoctonia solani AG-1 IA]|uniref:Uncharacterized protein n=1 Tax=Thanatephorus cucumeris (strain AG1-IA) TaxID=983506 RepID=L8WSI6_THACA|nr:hypothetical protein AG1IA_04877 [Rhizoctonia solani AG-1 IA]